LAFDPELAGSGQGATGITEHHNWRKGLIMKNRMSVDNKNKKDIEIEEGGHAK
jgi:hypothetical protein